MVWLATITSIAFAFLAVTRGAPVPKRMVDLTHVFDNTTLNHPLTSRFEASQSFVSTNDYRFMFEDYTSGTHAGTHMDSPSHVIPGGMGIDEIPLNRLIAPAAVIDMTDKAEKSADAEAGIEDLLQWEESTGQNLNGTIVLLRTGWSRRWDNSTAYFGSDKEDMDTFHTPALSADAALWLVTNRNIYGLGTDTFSIDLGNTRVFPVHHIILGAGIYAIENMASMEELPVSGATLYVMPMKIGKASGAPTRIIATFPDIEPLAQRSKETSSLELSEE